MTTSDYFNEWFGAFKDLLLEIRDRLPEKEAESHLEKLEAMAEAARSVLSEDGVKEYLSSYVMGVELISRLAALEG